MTVISLLSASTLPLNMCNQKSMRYLKRAFIEGAQLLRELSCISYVEHLLGLYIVSCNAFAIRQENSIFQKYLSFKYVNDTTQQACCETGYCLLVGIISEI